MVVPFRSLPRSSSALRTLVASYFWILLLPTGGTALGQFARPDLPLTVEVHSSSYTSRTDGPIPLQLQVNWSGAGVLRGNLLLELRDGSERLGIFRLPDLYLPPGLHELTLLLPPLTTNSYSEFYDLLVWLQQDGQSTALAPQQLRIPGVSSRKFVLMVGTPELELQRPETSQLASGWDFDQLQPGIRPGDDSRRKRNLTLINTIAAEELPTQALRYCAWDVLLLADTGFAILDERQRDSLHAWVRAGGSLIVALRKSALPASHLNSLNELLAEHPQQAQLLPQADASPLITITGGAEAPYIACRSGLGRVVILSGQVDSTTITRRLSPVVWKLCEDQAIAVQKEGTWSLPNAYKSAIHGFAAAHYLGSVQSPDVRMLLTNFDNTPVGGGNGLMERLLPRQFRLVPLWLMGSILALFILAIGPFDYLWLGLLPSRKWTWISFPLLAVGFTGLSVAISNAYMNTGDHRGRLILRDITAGGLVARENEFQLMFNNASKTLSTEVTSSLFTPLRISQFTQNEEAWNPRAQLNDEPTIQVGPPVIEGFLPQSAIVRQSVAQWTPQLNRLLRIPASTQIDETGFDWDAEVRWTEWEQLRPRVQAAFGPEATAHIYRAARNPRTSPHYEKIVVQGDRNLTSSALTSQYRTASITVAYENETSTPADFLRDISIREQRGLFAVVSQVAPHGGNQLEDLTLLDATDRDSLLLIVMAPQADESFLVYRRLFTQGASL